MTTADSIPPPVDLVPAQNSNTGPGLRLHAAREKAGLSLHEAAAQLHLTPVFVDAMERDDYSNAPNRVFIRGYLRSYSNLLNLSSEEILAAFDTLNIKEAKVEVPTVPIFNNTNRISFENFTPWIIRIFILGTLILLFFWWRNHVNEETANLTTLPPEKITTESTVPAIPLSAPKGKVLPLVPTNNGQSLKPATITEPSANSANSHTAEVSTMPATETINPIDNSASHTGGRINKNALPMANKKLHNNNANTSNSNNEMPTAANVINPAIFPLHNVPAQNTTAGNNQNTAGTSDQAQTKPLKAKHKAKGRGGHGHSKKKHIRINSPF